MTTYSLDLIIENIKKNYPSAKLRRKGEHLLVEYRGKRLDIGLSNPTSSKIHGFGVEKIAKFMSDYEEKPSAVMAKLTRPLVKDKFSNRKALERIFLNAGIFAFSALFILLVASKTSITGFVVIDGASSLYNAGIIISVIAVVLLIAYKIKSRK